MDENWCYNCDSKHEDKTDCRYMKPVSICIDSVIDFSANDRGEPRYYFNYATKQEKLPKPYIYIYIYGIIAILPSFISLRQIYTHWTD